MGRRIRQRRRGETASGSFCRTLPISAQASSLRRFLRSSTEKSLPPFVRDSRSQVTGADTGAPARERGRIGRDRGRFARVAEIVDEDAALAQRLGHLGEVELRVVGGHPGGDALGEELGRIPIGVRDRHHHVDALAARKLDEALELFRLKALADLARGGDRSAARQRPRPDRDRTRCGRRFPGCRAASRAREFPAPPDCTTATRSSTVSTAITS